MRRKCFKTDFEYSDRNVNWKQCDQIGRFLKVLATYLISKVAQIIGHFWEYLRNIFNKNSSVFF